MADNNVAEILTLQFQLDAAEALLKQAHRVTQAASYPHGVLTTVSGLSRIEAWRGNSTEALSLQLQALDGFRALGADDHVADSLVRLAEIHILSGEAAWALDVVDQAARTIAGLGDVAVLPATLSRLHARALLLAGHHAEARRKFQAALDLASADGFVYEIALASMGLGRMDNDDQRVAVAMAQLKDLGVVAPPPGS
ncbi:MAG TPA: tetratricopeptide repeat protein [Ilumatobacteraceae bacterium]|nr:tetratricopeptide repeat protein [Ilumatobacteraceae bacterium]